MENLKQDEVKNFIRIIIIVIVIFLGFYLLTVITTGRRKIGYTSRQSIPSIIQYDEIILGDLYNQKENSYYVLIEEQDNPYSTLFKNLLNQYKNKENGLSYYTVDLSSAFNQRFIGETSSFEPNNLKITGSTLLKISEHTIVEYYETNDTILNVLQSVNQ